MRSQYGKRIHITTDIEDKLGDDKPDKSITALQCKDNYLDTGLLNTDLQLEGRPSYGNPHPVVRRFREWRLNVPRAAFDEQGNPLTNKPRLRDTYLLLSLHYSNLEDFKFRLHNILTKFRAKQF